MEIKLSDDTYIPRRIFCIGKNYAKHVAEMKSAIPSSPVIFCKPSTSLVPPGEDVHYPAHGTSLHYEAEIVVLIGKEGKAISSDEAVDFISGLSLGLDLTMRDIQNELKTKGHPWETSKAFDESAPVGEFAPLSKVGDLEAIGFRCYVNDELRQDGNSSNMIFPITRLITSLSEIWQLLPGDLIYTGTPEGVGELSKGDSVRVEGEAFGAFQWKIV
ncbi:MAG: isomerase/hydrolase [candidate division Zixibacteria bacterium]|nr:isomerase/hydrolase [candidate division Zixibacteria bacterium]